MPAADINNVSVTFGFGVKREEFGPVKKAEATISASVPEGHDGVIALNYISKVARDKVGELLGLSAAQHPTQTFIAENPEAFSDDKPDTGRGQTLPPAGDTGDQGEASAPTRRRRRTNAEIAADNAAASAPAQPQTDAEQAEPTAPSVSTDAGQASSEPSGDEWDTPASAAPITDDAILSATSATAGRTGKREPILALKETYRNLEKFPADQKFGVTDIPQEFRQDYLNKLALLPSA